MKIPRNPFSEETEDLRARQSYLAIVVLIIFALLMLRVWYLQIIRGYEYRVKSESNRTRIQDIPPARGVIMDRNGVILVENVPSYDLAILREDVDDPKALVNKLAFLLGVPYLDLWDQYKEIRKKPAFKPAVILSGLTHDNLVALETHRYELPGAVIQVKPKRKYLYDRLASHVVGYLGEITQTQLGNNKYKESRMGDLVGQHGVERVWEEYLHGLRGRRMVEVDASGRVLKVLKKINPEPGNNLYLTLDAELQQAAQEALGESSGAVVALDPNSGEILAIASMPTFSPNDFIEGISSKKWKELLENPLHPLENRAISGLYPPGSTYKIISAAAALEENAVTTETRLPCAGGFPFGDRVFHCWNKGGHGQVNMHRSLKESCDIYYYEVGLRVGVDKLAEYARAFGLGRKPGLGLPGEKAGLTPTKQWKKKRFKKPWRPGETLSIVIGQGYTQATPLQMAQVVAVAANGGTLYKSHLVKKITDSEGEIVKEIEPEIVRKLNFKPETIKAIQDGLNAVVNEPGGTGRRARLDYVSVAGKTGTAQVIALKKFRGWRKKDLPYKYRDHAWFVAYAPVEEPKIAVAVVVEHSGGGGAVAAPVAKKVLDAFFHPKDSSEDLKASTEGDQVETGN